MGKDTIDELLDKGIKAAKTKDMAFAIIYQGKNAAIGIGLDETAAKKNVTKTAGELGIAGTPKTGTVKWNKKDSEYNFEIDEASPAMGSAMKAAFERDLGKKISFTCLPPIPLPKGAPPKAPSGGSTSPMQPMGPSGTSSPQQPGRGDGVNAPQVPPQQDGSKMPSSAPPRQEGQQPPSEQNGSGAPPKIDPRMARKLDKEIQDYIKRTYPERSVWEGKIQSVTKMPPEKQDASYEIVGRQVSETMSKVKDDKEIDEDFRGKQVTMLSILYQQISQARNQLNRGDQLQQENEKAKGPIEQYDKGKRRNEVLERLEKLKPDMKKAEQTPQTPETVKPLTTFSNAKAGLLVALRKEEYDLADGHLDTLEKTLPLVIGVGGLAMDKMRDTVVTQKSLQSMSGNLKPDPKGSFAPNSTKQVSKDTDRTVVGHGPMFKPVLKALAEVEKTPVDPHLKTLEDAARNYLADYNRRVNEATKEGKDKDLQKLQTDPVTQAKVAACNDAIEKVRKLRVRAKIQSDLDQLPKSGKWTDEQLAQGNRLKAQMIVESGGSKPLDDNDGKGASESFFLTDPSTGEKAFIFKPIDGEYNAGYGWEDGGGAPREVALSAVSETLRKSTGLDCGVSSTTLVAINNPNVASEKNGNNPQRTGAIQNFVKADKSLSAKMNRMDPSYDANFINQIPPEEIEKVAILDFATLQMDRQETNLLIAKDDQGKPRITPIDAGNAMPSRKGFEASRRMFTNNAVLSGDEAKKPFSKEALDKINAIDENEIVAGLKKANSEMAKVDPKAGQAIGDENIEMTRRSIRFLKKAAGAGLTKADIGDAYANLFQKILDVKPNEVDATIDAVIQEQLAKPGVVDEIDKIPNNSQKFIDLGWPAPEFATMKTEDPSRLLKILQQNRECPSATAKIKQLIAEIGTANIGFDPASYKSLSQRLTELQKRKDEIDDDKTLADPQLEKTMKKLGWEFTVINAKGESKPMVTKSDKADLVRRMQGYIAAGGDEALKKKKLNPSKMTTEQKIYEGLGGDEKYAELEKKGYSPTPSKNLAYRINDLEYAKEYEELGGHEMYVKLGCPQNKDVSLFSRIGMMKSKMQARTAKEADVGGPEAVVESLHDLLGVIVDTTKKCEQAEKFFTDKRPTLDKFVDEATKPMTKEAQTKRLKEIEDTDMEIGNQMKKFGTWNRDIISPWKTIQGDITNQKLTGDKSVKPINRKVTQAYDAYVAVFGSAQDLGQDYLDLLRRLKKQTQGDKGDIDAAVGEVKKIEESMTSDTFGAATMLGKQATEVNRIKGLAANAVGKTGTFGEQQWDEVAEWDTKTRQAFEIAKANYRATVRAKANARDYLKAWNNDPKIQNAVKPVLVATAKAEKDYNELDGTVKTLLVDIGKLESQKPAV